MDVMIIKPVPMLCMQLIFTQPGAGLPILELYSLPRKHAGRLQLKYPAGNKSPAWSWREGGGAGLRGSLRSSVAGTGPRDGYAELIKFMEGTLDTNQQIQAGSKAGFCGVQLETIERMMFQYLIQNRVPCAISLKGTIGTWTSFSAEVSNCFDCISL